jgi:hypothetical protein
MFLKKAEISNFIKIRLVGAELFQAGGRKGERTDGHDEAKSPFMQLCERA